jgi:hypothetical protein
VVLVATACTVDRAATAERRAHLRQQRGWRVAPVVQREEPQPHAGAQE